MNKIKQYASLLIVAVVTTATAEAQTRVLTLDDCREMALENNAKMKTAEASVSQARSAKNEAFTNFFPTVSATGTAFNMNKGLIEIDMGPEMGSMSMLKNGIVGGVTFTQPIFVGGQIINGNRLAELGITVSELQLRQSRNEVLLTTEQYYWQIVSLKEKEQTLLSLKTMLDTITHDVNVAVNAGIAYQNDLLQVQLRTNEVESGLLNIRNGISVCRMVLAQYIGESGTAWEIAPLDNGHSLPEHPQTYYCDHASALANTPEYNLLNSNVKAQKLQYKMSVGKNLPSVAVGGGYMFDNLLDKDRTYVAGFVTVSVPISGWWGGSHAMRKQKTAVNMAEIELSDKSELLMVKMQSSWNDLLNSYNQIEIAISSIAQAKENMRLDEARYRAGTVSMSDLLEAQSLYQQSCDKYAEVYADYCVKRVIYLQSTGR